MGARLFTQRGGREQREEMGSRQRSRSAKGVSGTFPRPRGTHRATGRGLSRERSGRFQIMCPPNSTRWRSRCGRSPQRRGCATGRSARKRAGTGRPHRPPAPIAGQLPAALTPRTAITRQPLLLPETRSSGAGEPTRLRPQTLGLSVEDPVAPASRLCPDALLRDFGGVIGRQDPTRDPRLPPGRRPKPAASPDLRVRPAHHDGGDDLDDRSAARMTARSTVGETRPRCSSSSCLAWVLEVRRGCSEPGPRLARAGLVCRPRRAISNGPGTTRAGGSLPGGTPARRHAPPYTSASARRRPFAHHRTRSRLTRLTPRERRRRTTSADAQPACRDRSRRGPPGPIHRRGPMRPRDPEPESPTRTLCFRPRRRPLPGRCAARPVSAARRGSPRPCAAASCAAARHLPEQFARLRNARAATIGSWWIGLQAGRPPDNLGSPTRGANQPLSHFSPAATATTNVILPKDPKARGMKSLFRPGGRRGRRFITARRRR